MLEININVGISQKFILQSRVQLASIPFVVTTPNWLLYLVEIGELVELLFRYLFMYIFFFFADL